jgi:hypothetical protein
MKMEVSSWVRAAAAGSKPAHIPVLVYVPTSWYASYQLNSLVLHNNIPCRTDGSHLVELPAQTQLYRVHRTAMTILGTSDV